MTVNEKLKTIYKAFERCGIRNDHQIAEAIGMPYMTLHKRRLTAKMLGEMKLREFWAMQKKGQFLSDEIEEIAKA